ncbi:MAG: ABC transporter ATP-binding protein/permease [Hyphomicrobiales bacterium]|nr:ABC transporter ATP-binding protein/permease [Hyphomicrobiales bacterium]MBV8423187.1 ABC transporter ATP-binding protein/permease [Hyphomicrobiales bacterium]
MSRLLSTLAIIWRLARPYFFSEDRWAGRVLLGTVIAIELSVVAINVMLNQWNNRFYNALQERNWDAFIYELGFFCVLAAIYIALAVYQLYLNQWLQIRWRRWMTQHYLDHWLAAANHYRMQLLGDAADNPDQRIAEDINMFIDRTLTISVGLLSAIVTLVSFVVILWTLSAAAPLHLFGASFTIPGYLVWAALLYAAVGTTLTHLIGWPLVSLNFRQQRFEADFRFNLVRVRENSEQIALLGGETAERERLLDRFGYVVGNFMQIMQRTKKLTFLTSGYTQISIVFPFIVISPAYFAGAVQLGGLMQTASAFTSVQTALSFFVNAYRSLAEWRAVIARLDGFNIAAERARAAATAPQAIAVSTREGRDRVEIDDLLVRLPQGTPLVAAADIAIAAGERVLLTGPSGSGKSTLFRAIAGTWPFGAGTIRVPKGAKLMALPQRPYFPIGTLTAAVTYPAEPGTFGAEALSEVITAVGLPALAGRITEEAHWNRMLSLGEQQRLGIARAILQAPDYLFLDEATASLDEAAEAALYRLLNARLKRTTIVSIGHRSTLAAFHRRGLVLERDGELSRLREAALAPAAE